jgi:hypothetical protein
MRLRLKWMIIAAAVAAAAAAYAELVLDIRTPRASVWRSPMAIPGCGRSTNAFAVGSQLPCSLAWLQPITSHCGGPGKEQIDADLDADRLFASFRAYTRAVAPGICILRARTQWAKR